MKIKDFDERTQVIYNKLVEVAEAHNKITYDKIASLEGVERNLANDEHCKELWGILTRISIHTFKYEPGKPLLSAVVVQDEGNGRLGLPGLGFFEMAKQLGIYNGPNFKQFFSEQLQKVYDRWAIEKPDPKKHLSV